LPQEHDPKLVQERAAAGGRSQAADLHGCGAQALRGAAPDYFNLSEKDARVAKASHHQEGPTLEQILHLIRTMPAETAIQKRNRAVLAWKHYWGYA
jgi:hypothetical protein